MEMPAPRMVTLLLCTPDSHVLGTLPPFDVAVPWWQDAASVVQEARSRYGVDVTVLRVVGTEHSAGPPGGRVTYLAEIAEAPPLSLAPLVGADPLADNDKRLTYARPGGPALDLAWADAELARLGRPRTGDAVQIRSWNLSSIWRLPTAAATAWLKVIPPFSLMKARSSPRSLARLPTSCRR